MGCLPTPGRQAGAPGAASVERSGHEACPPGWAQPGSLGHLGHQAQLRAPNSKRGLGASFPRRAQGCGDVHWPPVPEALPVPMGKATRGRNSLGIRTKYICPQLQSTHHVGLDSGIQHSDETPT